jgi:hypothetical protein
MNLRVLSGFCLIAAAAAFAGVLYYDARCPTVAAFTVANQEDLTKLFAFEASAGDSVDSLQALGLPEEAARAVAGDFASHHTKKTWVTDVRVLGVRRKLMDRTATIWSQEDLHIVRQDGSESVVPIATQALLNGSGPRILLDGLTETVR